MEGLFQQSFAVDFIPRRVRGRKVPSRTNNGNTQAATASTGATVTDAQAVRQLCEAHCFGTLNWEVDEEGELIIWGYDAFEIYETREDGLPDYEGGLVTHEFLLPKAGQLSRIR